MKKTAQTSPEQRARPAGRRLDDALLPVFRDMARGAVHGVLVHSNFKPLFVNDAFARLFGYAHAKDIMELPLLRPLFAADVWPDVEDDYNAIIRSRSHMPMARFRGLRKDGTEIWLSATRRAI